MLMADEPLLPLLSADQIQTFLLDGVLVVENVLTESEVAAAVSGLRQTLTQCPGGFIVDTDDLVHTGHNLRHLSSTHGSGGVLDIFYEPWKLNVAAHPKLFAITTELWEAAYCHRNERKEDLLSSEELFKWHPYGALDCRKGYMYIDRIGYRLPTKLAEDLGTKCRSPVASSYTPKTKQKKTTPIQRSLTPHLDCCPDTLFSDHASKWRPIQCLVALTDAIEPETGGFEAARGFHRTFKTWAANRAPTVGTRKVNRANANGVLKNEETFEYPAPCVGEYTHIRPKEDRDVMERVQHVAVPAGSAVFWDHRIPHANAYRHNGEHPRVVVYCSFLPDVSLNRQYCAKQLENWKRGRNPTDQWINSVEGCNEPTSDETAVHLEKHEDCIKEGLSTPLARHLAGVDPWDA